METKGDSRRMWSAVKELLHGETASDNGNKDENAAFSNSLQSFFINKVNNIKSAIVATLAGIDPEPLSSDVPCQYQMSEFAPVTAAEAQRLLTSMASKSSPLDFVPTSLLKACSGAFSGIIANLANLTFQSGSFPARFKIAQITPLLKKTRIERNRPVELQTNIEPQHHQQGARATGSDPNHVSHQLVGDGRSVSVGVQTRPFN